MRLQKLAICLKLAKIWANNSLKNRYSGPVFVVKFFCVFCEVHNNILIDSILAYYSDFFKKMCLLEMILQNLNSTFAQRCALKCSSLELTRDLSKKENDCIEMSSSDPL